MTSRKVTIAISMLVGALVATGCGKVDLVAVDPGGGAQVPGGIGGPSLNKTPIVVAPTPSPPPTYNPPLQMGKLEARLTKFDKGYVFGLFGTKTAYVEVKNSTQVPLKGTVKVQFTDNGAPLADKPAQTKEVELQPGSVENLTFAEKGYKIDNATVTVVTDGANAPAASGPQAPAQGGAGASVYGTPPGAYR